MSNRRSLKQTANQAAWSELDPGPKVVVPKTILDHENYLRMKWSARSLLWDIAAQFTGHNNGFLCASFSVMQERNWGSKTTLAAALAEVEHYGLIVKTQQGDRTHKPNLFALTWRKINKREGATLLTPDWAYVQPMATWKESRPLYDPDAEVERKAA